MATMDTSDRWVGSYRFVIRSVLWVIYLAVALWFMLWWVTT
jgi:hypothetical protein